MLHYVPLTTEQLRVATFCCLNATTENVIHPVKTSMNVFFELRIIVFATSGNYAIEMWTFSVQYNRLDVKIS